MSSPSRGAVAIRRPRRKSNLNDSADQPIVAAYRGGASVAEIARRMRLPQGAVTWVLKKAGLKPNDRRRPRTDERGDVARDDAAQCCRAQDMAFQQAMRRAIAAGKERPPLDGVFIDKRPLDTRQVFIAVAHSSGCGSPASECADLYQPLD